MEVREIEFEVGDDHVATITLDRPDALNSFTDGWPRRSPGRGRPSATPTTSTRWCSAPTATARSAPAPTSPASRAGSTKSNVWNSFDPGVTLSPKFHYRCWKPVVVAVHGMCAGGGQYFLNEADIIVSADDATFFDPHANVGIVSALEPIGMLARGVPLGDVLRWALMGTEERITAETALRLGLVTEVVPRAELRDRAHDDRSVDRGARSDRHPGHRPRHLGVARHDPVDGAAQRHRVHAHRQPEAGRRARGRGGP